MKAIVGKKLAMTRFFNEKNQSVPVTVIEIPRCVVVQIKTMDRDGYKAICLGAFPARSSLVSKPRSGLLKKIGYDKTVKIIREVAVDDVSMYQVKQEVGVEIFEGTHRVHITGKTKGRGFTGTVKRYHFTLGPKSHGSKNYRKPGAIGAHTFPARVFQGKRMYGHSGDAQRTIRNVEVVKIDKDNNVLIVKGGVPGASNGFLYIRKAS